MALAMQSASASTRWVTRRRPRLDRRFAITYARRTNGRDHEPPREPQRAQPRTLCGACRSSRQGGQEPGRARPGAGRRRRHLFRRRRREGHERGLGAQRAGKRASSGFARAHGSVPLPPRNAQADNRGHRWASGRCRTVPRTRLRLPHLRQEREADHGLRQGRALGRLWRNLLPATYSWAGQSARAVSPFPGLERRRRARQSGWSPRWPSRGMFWRRRSDLLRHSPRARP